MPRGGKYYTGIPKGRKHPDQHALSCCAGQERDAEAGTRSYVLKRNLSNAAVHVLTLTLPEWVLQAGCLLDTGDGGAAAGGVPSPPQPCSQGDVRPWRAAPTMALPDDLSTGGQPCRTSRHPRCSLIKTRASAGCAWGRRCSIAHARPTVGAPGMPPLLAAGNTHVQRADFAAGPQSRQLSHEPQVQSARRCT